MALTRQDHELLEHESRRWKYAGSRESPLSRRTEMGTVAYSVRLNMLIDDPEAEAAYPLLVRRLRRLRAIRRTRRSQERHHHAPGPVGVRP